MTEEKKLEPPQEAVARPRGLGERIREFMVKWEHWLFAVGFISAGISAGIVFARFQQSYAHHSDRFDQIYTNVIQINKQLGPLISLADEWYPSNGLIATFPVPTQKDIKTPLDQDLSLLSDNAHGGSSYAWYERIPEDLGTSNIDSDGFLRIHYYLNPSQTNDLVPYVGVFAFFANPPKMFDVTGFNEVQVIARANVTNGASCEYSFHLMDNNAALHGDYRWAQFTLGLTASTGRSNWIPTKMLIADMQTPKPFPPTDFDRKHVFGFLIQIKTERSKHSEGYLDIHDIKFQGGTKQ